MCSVRNLPPHDLADAMPTDRLHCVREHQVRVAAGLLPTIRGRRHRCVASHYWEPYTCGLRSDGQTIRLPGMQHSSG